jgi:diguanylate cyclase (GGDEF)-like protein
MIRNILVAALYVSLAIPVFIGTFTLICCERKKRLSFIALLSSIFLYMLGYLLEITARSTEGGLIGTKIMYLGSSFLAPVYLVFTADYCGIKLDKKIIAISLLVPLAIISLIWTTEIHKLIYTSFEYNTASPIHYLSFKPGLLYPLIHIYSAVCALTVIGLLISRLTNRGRENNTILLLLFIGACVPVILNMLYILKISPFGIHFTPVSMIILNIAFYCSITNHNLFDIIPKASELALESIKEAFIIVDSKNNFISSNEAADELFPSLQAIKKNSPITEVGNWPAELQTPEKGTSVNFVMPGDFYYSATVDPIVSKKGNLLGHIILIQNNTNSVRLTKELEEIAFTDSLTGILNRRHFLELAEGQIDRVKRLSNDAFVAIFDIDHFKEVNDTYGHIIGDKVLKCLTERVKGTIRPYDLFSRYGGEEFILLIPDITETNAVNHMERIRLAINNRPMVFEDTQITVSASFGLVSVISAGNLENAIKYSDEALYQGKNEGRNRVILAQIPNGA